jgi:hypothetical protein
MNLPTGTNGAFFYTFIALALFAMLNNLIAGFLEKELWRKISKPFCLLFLGVAVAIAVPQYPMVYLAAFAGFLGDIVLIWKDNKLCVGAGVVCFWIGHGLYIASILKILYDANAFSTSLAWLYMLLFVVVFMGLMVYPMWRLTNHSKVFAPIGVFYSTILVSVGASAILGCALGFSQYLYLIIIGDIFFILSDSFLTYTLFIKDVKRRDFYIMLTYLLGQLFILSGLVLTLLK